MKQYIRFAIIHSKDGEPPMYYLERHRAEYDNIQSIYNITIMRHVWESNDLFTMFTHNGMLWHDDRNSRYYPHSAISYIMPNFLTINLDQFNIQQLVGIE